jgi:ribonuclease HII
MEFSLLVLFGPAVRSEAENFGSCCHTVLFNSHFSRKVQFFSAPGFSFDLIRSFSVSFLKKGPYMIIECGCDEAGRGAGAAEVYVGAVILNPEHPIAGLADSKQLTAHMREHLSREIKRYSLSWCVEKASLEEIERLNVLHATLLAMRRAVQGLKIRPHRVLVDGNHAPCLDIQVEAIIKGDQKVPAISAASILAKVARDEAMIEYHRLYPQYGFDSHKGYFTREHMDALQKYGPCPIHRVTYAPVRQMELFQFEKKGAKSKGQRA